MIDTSWLALYPVYEHVYEAFNEMAYDSHDAVNEEIVMDFVNRMRLTNAKYAFMSTVLGIRYAPKSAREAFQYNRSNSSCMGR